MRVSVTTILLCTVALGLTASVVAAAEDQKPLAVLSDPSTSTSTSQPPPPAVVQKELEPISFETPVDQPSEETNITVTKVNDNAIENLDTVVDTLEKSDNERPIRETGLVDGLLGGLLGIDIGGRRNNRDREDDPPSVNSYREDDQYEYIPLYGDDGYVPRPLPRRPSGQPPCEQLAFLDQMIWDQQGDRGPRVPVGAPSDDNKDEKGIQIVQDNKLSSDDIKEVKDIKIGEMEKSGISICLLGPCHNDEEEDRDYDRDRGGRRPRRIRHRQREFLLQFRGKALRINDRTLCPILSNRSDRRKETGTY